MQGDSEFWLIPKEIYEPLNGEFHFDFDPCPYPFRQDGIEIEWGQSNWVNPPFRTKDSINGHGPTAFVRKAIEEQTRGKTSVIILPVQSYINMLLLAGVEIRPVGRVKWIDGRTGQAWKNPSNNALFILKGMNTPPNSEDECPCGCKGKLHYWCKDCGEGSWVNTSHLHTHKTQNSEDECKHEHLHCRDCEHEWIQGTFQEVYMAEERKKKKARLG